MSGGRQAAVKRRRRRLEAIDSGWRTVRASRMLTRLATDNRVSTDHDTVLGDAWAVVDTTGKIRANAGLDGEPAEWAWVFAHLLLHLGLGHLERRSLRAADAIRPGGGGIDPVYVAACDVAVNRFAETVRIGRSLIHLPEMPGTDEWELLARWRLESPPAEYFTYGTGGSRPCLALDPDFGRPLPPWRRPPTSWPDLFAQGLADAARQAMEQAAQTHGQIAHRRTPRAWDRALAWFVSSYPLLGAIAAGMTLVDDPEIVRAWDIGIAAVDAGYGEVYVNPHAGLSDEEWRFVLAHEMLHAALRHGDRADGRDGYLWNVACDYVINGWLVAMGVGQLPEGSLYDPGLVGMSAESVYDTLVTDLRRVRKLRTLGSRTAGDVLGDWLSVPDAAHRRGSRRCSRDDAQAAPPWRRGDRVRAVDLDDFYRRALITGLEYHHRAGRGTIPAGLEQEIRVLRHPPLPWDARLARWFDEHVRAPQPVRSYARASRRQATTPDIPRPGRVHPERLHRRSTFGVVLDTSGSMGAELLGKALGAVASYAIARDVPAARVVFCDAVAYDAGYLPVEEIAGRVTVRGRSGTVLQPGVRLLEGATDFPPDGPILVITDAACDILRVRREHAYLVPAGARLPFTPRGPVFRVT